MGVIIRIHFIFIASVGSCNASFEMAVSFEIACHTFDIIWYRFRSLEFVIDRRTRYRLDRKYGCVY